MDPKLRGTTSEGLTSNKFSILKGNGTYAASLTREGANSDAKSEVLKINEQTNRTSLSSIQMVHRSQLLASTTLMMLMLMTLVNNSDILVYNGAVWQNQPDLQGGVLISRMTEDREWIAVFLFL